MGSNNILEVIKHKTLGVGPHASIFKLEEDATEIYLKARQLVMKPGDSETNSIEVDTSSEATVINFSEKEALYTLELKLCT